MNPRVTPRILGLTIGLLATIAVAPSFADETGKPVGDVVYKASFKDLKDKTTSLGELKGKVVLLYFWATWCVPCRIETPNLVKLSEAYKGKDVQIVGIALDSGDKVRSFVKDNAIPYSIFYGSSDAVQFGKALGNDQGAIPFTVIIGKDGKLIRTFGGDLPNTELMKIIDPLIG